MVFYGLVGHRANTAVDGEKGVRIRRGSIYLIQRVLSTEGVSALFVGITPQLANIVLAYGMMIACFEVCSVHL